MSQSSTPWGRELPAEIVRVFGDLRGRLDGDVVALCADERSVCVMEEGGLMRRFDRTDLQMLEAVPMSDLEEAWAFHRNGELLASGGTDVAVWKVEDESQLYEFAVAAPVTCLAFGPSDRWLAAGDRENVVHLWDLRTGVCRWSFQGHEGPIAALAFRRDGRALASAGEDRRVVLWDLESGKRMGELIGHTDRIEALDWSPAGDFLASASWDSSVRLWDPNSFELKALLNGQAEHVLSVQFLSDGGRLICGDSDGAVRVWDHRNLAVAAELRTGRGPVRHLAVTEGSTQAAIGATDRSILLWDFSNGRCVPEEVAVGGAIADLHFTSSDDFVAIHDEGRLSIWDFETALLLEGPEVPAASALAADRQGAWAAGHENGSITFFPAGEDASEVNWTAHDRPVRRLAMHPAGKLLASSCGTDGTVHLWDPRSAAPILIIPEAIGSASVETLAFHPTRDLLGVGGVDWTINDDARGSVAFWSWRTRSRELVLPVATTSLGFSDDGKYAATLTEDGAVLIWDFLAAEMVQELSSAGVAANAFAFDPLRRWIAAVCRDGGLRIWSLGDWKLINVVDLESMPRAVAFAPDGGSILVGNVNGCCYLVDLADLSRSV